MRIPSKVSQSKYIFYTGVIKYTTIKENYLWPCMKGSLYNLWLDV